MIGITLIICGWSYACSRGISNDVSERGLYVSRQIAWVLTALGALAYYAEKYVL